MPTTSKRSRCSRAFVGAFQAKTHFSQLLERVAALFCQMDALRQGLPRPKNKTTLKDLINPGRRF
jgi:hypothetical protein